MIVKELYFGDDAREKLRSGIKKLARAVKSTLGASGKYVAIESGEHTGGLTTTKDGVTVANSVYLDDPIENLAVRMVKQAAQNTATAAGDGTTTSIVLAEAIIENANNLIKDENNKTEVTRHIKSFSEKIIKNLEKRAKKLTGRRLYHVATVSANNDKFLGKLIGDAYKYVGKNGVVTVRNSKTTDTHVENIDGMLIERGYNFKYYVNDDRRNECVLDNPLMLVFDQELPDFRQIEHILEYVVKHNRSLLIIGELSLDASQTFAYNVAVQKTIKGCHIIPPSFGNRREEMMQDICTATGATYISEKLGNDWNTITPSDLGEAERVVVNESRTILINNTQKLEVVDLISDLNAQLKEESDDRVKEAIRERISALNGKAAVINVGGGSDIEQKEKKDRVDDSVLATRAALEEGILPGGGIALLNEAWNGMPFNGDRDEMTAIHIMEESLKAPFVQILENGGNDSDIVIDNIIDKEYGYGYDVKAEKYGNMLQMGIIDPAKVTKSALRNAVSVANTIMMCETTITNKIKA